MNKISVIVPVYNSENWLKRCIHSLINQTYKNIEIILINDGSLDKSGDICDAFKIKDNRIKVIHKQNEGVSVARNTGIEASTGDYIQFVDSDDELQYDACETMLTAMLNNDADEVFCGLNIYKDKKLLRTPHLENKVLNVSKNFEDFKFIYRLLASPCNKLYKREIVERFDVTKSLGEDFLFNLNTILKTNTVVSISKCLYNVYLDNESSLNRKFRENRMDLLIQLDKEKLTICKNHYKNECYDSFFNSLAINDLHAYLRDICKLKGKKYCLNKIKNYMKDEFIQKSLENCSFNATDKKLFGILLKAKNSHLIYAFFKAKILLIDKARRKNGN